jgi:hypothetical protein
MKKILFLILLLAARLDAAVAFKSVGSIVGNATTTTLNIVSPGTGYATNDILIAAINGKDNLQITAPGAQGNMGAWTIFAEGNNTANQRFTLACARATGDDADGDTFGFTKSTDNNLLFAGVISQWSGALTTGTCADALDATAESISNNASADDVTYATFDPTETNAFVVAIGFYNEDLTTAGSISGTDPTYTNRWDLEVPTGTDCSIFGYSGASSGAATGSRTHSTTSTVDAINIGVQFGFKEAPPTAGVGWFGAGWQ